MRFYLVFLLTFVRGEFPGVDRVVESIFSYSSKRGRDWQDNAVDKWNQVGGPGLLQDMLLSEQALKAAVILVNDIAKTEVPEIEVGSLLGLLKAEDICMRPNLSDVLFELLPSQIIESYLYISSYRLRVMSLLNFEKVCVSNSLDMRQAALLHYVEYENVVTFHEARLCSKSSSPFRDSLKALLGSPRNLRSPYLETYSREDKWWEEVSEDLGRRMDLTGQECGGLGRFLALSLLHGQPLGFPLDAGVIEALLNLSGEDSSFKGCQVSILAQAFHELIPQHALSGVSVEHLKSMFETGLDPSQLISERQSPFPLWLPEGAQNSIYSGYVRPANNKELTLEQFADLVASYLPATWENIWGHWMLITTSHYIRSGIADKKNAFTQFKKAFVFLQTARPPLEKATEFCRVNQAAIIALFQEPFAWLQDSYDHWGDAVWLYCRAEVLFDKHVAAVALSLLANSLPDATATKCIASARPCGLAYSEVLEAWDGRIGRLGISIDDLKQIFQRPELVLDFGLGPIGESIHKLQRVVTDEFEILSNKVSNMRAMLNEADEILSSDSDSASVDDWLRIIDETHLDKFVDHHMAEFVDCFTYQKSWATIVHKYSGFQISNLPLLFPSLVAKNHKLLHVVLLHRLAASANSFRPFDRIEVSRTKIMDSSLPFLTREPTLNLWDLKIVEFEHEPVIGPGVTRDWVLELSREFAESLFANGKLKRDVADSHLFGFGRFLGFCLGRRHSYPFDLSMAFYASLIKKQFDLDDLAEIDPVLLESFRALLKFSADELADGEFEMMDRHSEFVLVTTENRSELVKIAVENFLEVGIDTIRRGFWDIVSLKSLAEAKISACDLKVLIEGEENAETVLKLEGYEASDDQIVWLLEFLREDGGELRRKFFRFVTGSYVVSKDPIVIGNAGNNIDQLPSSHTCARMLLLPRYPTKPLFILKLTSALNIDMGMGFV